MWRNSPPIAGSEVAEVVDELDKAGYYSILFPIKSTTADYLPLAISSMRREQKIKYMIPIRPYLLSPQYLSMLSAGIESVIPGRTIFNFINGHIDKDENLDGIIYSSIDFSDKTDRRRHLEKFIETLSHIRMHEQPDFSEVLVSGGSLETLEATHRLRVGLATSYSSFMQNHYEFYSRFTFKNIYVQVCLLVTELENDPRITEAIANNPSGVIYGSYSDISKKIQELESMGVTDLLISNAFDGGKEERLRIHSFVGSFSSIQ